MKIKWSPDTSVGVMIPTLILEKEIASCWTFATVLLKVGQSFMLH